MSLRGRREQMWLLRGAGLGWGEQDIWDLVVINLKTQSRHLIIFFFLGGTIIIPFHR